MPQNSWSAKRERQYALIKESLIEGGKPKPLAEGAEKSKAAFQLRKPSFQFERLFRSVNGRSGLATS
jgi:hypothetical protein